MTRDAAAITALALALGVLFSLICYLITNLSPGGMITPGWLALVLVNQPHRLFLIAGVVVLTYVVVRLLDRVVILYGKRLFATVVMVAVFLQATMFLVLARPFPQLFGFTTLGFIVPGLVAYQLRRQPVAATLLATVTISAVSYIVIVSGVLLGVLPGPEDIGALEGLSSYRASPLTVAVAGGVAAAGLVLLALHFRRVSRSAIPIPMAAGPSTPGRSSDPLRYIAASERRPPDEEDRG